MLPAFNQPRLVERVRHASNTVYWVAATTRLVAGDVGASPAAPESVPSREAVGSCRPVRRTRTRLGIGLGVDLRPPYREAIMGSLFTTFFYL